MSRPRGVFILVFSSLSYLVWLGAVGLRVRLRVCLGTGERKVCGAVDFEMIRVFFSLGWRGVMGLLRMIGRLFGDYICLR